jgi:hypothetical protein
MLRIRALLLLAFCGASVSQIAIQDPSDPHRASVSGRVLDEHSQPASGVLVQAAPDSPTGAILPHTLTDEHGRFKLVGLLPGRTSLNAQSEDPFDESSFYPNTLANFWDHYGVGEVDLPEGGDVAGIVLRIKPAARLVVKARNAATGAEIGDVGVWMVRVGDPSAWQSGTSRGNSWLVPTAPIRLCIAAHGFQPAWYGGDGSPQQSQEITLAPRQSFVASISLRPLDSSAVYSGCPTK